MILRTGLAAIFLIACTNFVQADGAISKIITKTDQAKLDGYEENRSAAVDAARKGGAPADVKQLEEILARPRLAFSENFDMTGEWKCRTIKLGKEPALVIYQWFKCRVTDDGSGWMLEKTSGSQRTKGRFYTESDTRLTYLGVGYVSGEMPGKYGGGPDVDQTGYAYRTGKDEFHIEFPEPARESLLDILELKR
ncbi:DUF4893 domain-containing protein [Phyllobacterium endophyticum]|uniref:DUF4893 domain-containing protein n=1 Tax=Phyllobacterium endophyticum TaxID=1149773 RepID=UPI0011CC84E5|nr:DUF4893 domain-containing protein [Phyllobacterium endophyticum]TXR50985.1 DUF4893 domain-containing protein [Phyllobacterium endophyticum]